MGQRSGVGLVELAIPEALDARRGRPAGGPISCEKLLAALEDELGLPRLLPVMIRTWTRAHHDEDLPAQPDGPGERPGIPPADTPGGMLLSHKSVAPGKIDLIGAARPGALVSRAG